ncbi:MAG: type II toxin-antitoxin system RelE/ParE family toxin [Deltaproteobacteria bacterium]|nr:type II toxin-antitoxin system RelE/ParE family toxin [Deltaproteobacteria bacterium]
MEQKRFKVIFSPFAERDIEKLEADDAIQIIRDIKTYLEASPLPFGKTRVKKLSGYKPPLYRLRSGNFRAYYQIHSQEVVILAITHKKDSEKILKKLR